MHHPDSSTTYSVVAPAGNTKITSHKQLRYALRHVLKSIAKTKRNTSLIRANSITESVTERTIQLKVLNFH